MSKELFKTKAGKLDLAQSSTEDRIAAYFVGKIEKSELSPKDQELIERWLNMWNSLNNYRSPQQAVNEHLKKYELLGKPISLRTAWNDLRGATKLWGNIGSTSEQARWILLYEYQMKTFNMAAQAKDRTEMNRSIKNLILINKYLKGDGDESIKPSTYVLQFNIQGKGAKTINLDKFGDIDDAVIDEVIEAMDQEAPTDIEIHSLLNPKDGNKGD